MKLTHEIKRDETHDDYSSTQSIEITINDDEVELMFGRHGRMAFLTLSPGELTTIYNLMLMQRKSAVEFTGVSNE